MNERTYERKDENYIPLGINAGGVISTVQYLSNRLTNPFMFGIILNSYLCSMLQNKFEMEGM